MPQFLKKFIIDDPISMTKRIISWLVHFVGIYASFADIMYYYCQFRRVLRMGKDGKVELLHLESEIVYGCNLCCEFCVAFSPYLKGYVTADELLASYAQWSEKVRPQRFVLTGGEPLLHPELPHIIRESTRIWKDSKLWLNTNALLLEHAPSEFFRTVRETGCKIIVTEHTFEPEHRQKLDAVYARLKTEGIYFVVRPSRSTWMALYQYDKQGSPIPYKSNPKTAWRKCISRICAIISDDKLYKCTPLRCVNDAAQKDILDTEAWKEALTYEPLSLQSTSEEIVAHLRNREVPECTICSETRIIVSARQLSLKEDKSHE